jgi:hypothetical protein
MSARILRWSIPVDDKGKAVTAAGDVIEVASTITGQAVEFWTLSMDADEAKPRTFRVFGTGQEVPDGWFHRGTAPRTPTGLVWHLFERGTQPSPPPTTEPLAASK